LTPVFKTNECQLSSELIEELIIVNVSDEMSTVVQNAFIKVTFDVHGRITSLIDKKLDRQVILPGAMGNVFKYFEDIPLFWDAWDVEVRHLLEN
jgi:alpha-mannosidase